MDRIQEESAAVPKNSEAAAPPGGEYEKEGICRAENIIWTSS